MSDSLKSESKYRYIRKHGLIHTLKVIREVYPRLAFRKFFHSSLNPSLLDFQQVFGEKFAPEPEKFIGSFTNLDQNHLNQFRLEFLKVHNELQERLEKGELNYSKNFGSERSTQFALYTLVRTTLPNIVVETGVANGESTFVLLKALQANNRGKLYSIDVFEDVGTVIDETMKEGWDLRILPKNNRKRFLELIQGLPSIDLFIHDSSHTYAWQSLEYNAAFDKLRSGGFLASDDVDASYAFIDFIMKHSGLNSFALFDGRKIFGLIKRN